ncbi:MAG: hypothetical protein IJ539_02385 [Prevotella sp.]|nr:hypothetical protein [Prevotella sp.]
MRRPVLMLLFLMVALMALAQDKPQKAPDDMVIITEQPEGQLKIYNRSGYVVRDDNLNASTPTEQTGVMSMVFAEDNVVYIEDPVSEHAYNRWVRGTLSDDGTTVTLPLGQYIDYIQSFDMALALNVLYYDDTQNTFIPDEEATEITYTINGDNVVLNGTSRQRILGTVYKPFRDFMELDGQWTGTGDYQSVYTPFDGEACTPPAGLETESLKMNASMFGGLDWEQLTTDVSIGEDATGFYLQGITTYIPKAWIKGSRSGDTITFPSGQFIGTCNGVPFYVVGARIIDGSYTVSDITFEDDGKGTLTSKDYIFITTEKDQLVYVVYYLGVTLSNKADELVSVPDDLEPATYLVNFQYHPQGSNTLSRTTKFIKVATHDGSLFVKGLWAQTPDGWARGDIDGDQLTFDLPQYLGTYDNEHGLVYPFYLIGFNTETGELLPKVTLHYDSATGTIDKASAGLGISINKTSFLAVQEYYNPVFTKFNDVPAVPSRPVITDFNGTDEKSAYITVNINGRSLNGTLIDPEQLGYQFYTDIEQDVQPFVLTTDRFERLTEDMTVIPYLFIDNDEQGYDIVYLDEHTRKVYLNTDPTVINRIGVQTVYTGGGEERRSDIVWKELKDYTGIDTTLSVDTESQPVHPAYNLQGQRVAPGYKGIVVANGRKTVKK